MKRRMLSAGAYADLVQIEESLDTSKFLIIHGDEPESSLVIDSLRLGGLNGSQDGGVWFIWKDAGAETFSGILMQFCVVTSGLRSVSLAEAAEKAHAWWDCCRYCDEDIEETL